MEFRRIWDRCVTAAVQARLHQSERGASLVEYALLVALIAMVCILAVQFLGTSTSAKFSSIGSGLS